MTIGLIVAIQMPFTPNEIENHAVQNIVDIMSAD